MTTSSPTLARGERILARERDARTRRHVVATAHAVYYQDLTNGLRAWHRLGWEQVERADWHPDRGELRLVSLAPQAAPDLTVRLAGPGRLVPLARERVGATTLARVPVHHDGHVVGSLTARRPAAGEGTVSWVVRLASGTALRDGELTDAIHDARVHAGV